MDIERFVRERRQGWHRLEQLLAQAEAAPDRELGRLRLTELLSLYRQACSDLNEARSYTANPEILGRLNDLTGRGYRFVYRGSRTRFGGAILRGFFQREVPAAFRRRLGYVWAAAAALGLGALLGFVAVVVQPDNGRRLIPPDFYSEQPRERVERIEEEEERIDTVEKALYFGVSLYTHNIQVSFLAFGLGAVSIVGGLWLLFHNGVILGAVSAMYVTDGVTGFLLAWIGPHGALEIPAIVFGGAAGLLAGRGLLLPGQRSAATALRRAFPDIWRMMVATALILVVAGLIEGSFSQFSSKTFPAAFKIGVAAVLFASLLAYLFTPRSAPPGAEP
jgi:uncharacterized membrane protein SpoIIM required for sporulation